MRNYSIAGKRGQWPAPEDTSLSYLSYSKSVWRSKYRKCPARNTSVKRTTLNRLRRPWAPQCTALQTDDITYYISC